MPTQEDLTKAFRGYIIKRIKDVSLGRDQYVYIVYCKEGTFVYKEPRDNYQKIVNEVKGCQLAEKSGIPAPKIIKKTKKYLIETYIPGQLLTKTRATKKIYKELGNYIKKLHENTCRFVGEKGWVTGKDEIELFERGMLNEVNGLCKVLPEYKKQIKTYFSVYKKLLCNTSKVYSHSDLYFSNIIVKNGRIAGIIDWGDLWGGYSEYDIAVIYIQHAGGACFKAFLEGYGPCNMDLVKFGAATRLTWMLRGDIPTKRKPELTKKRLALYLKLINDPICF